MNVDQVLNDYIRDQMSVKYLPLFRINYRLIIYENFKVIKYNNTYRDFDYTRQDTLLQVRVQNSVIQ